MVCSPGHNISWSRQHQNHAVRLGTLLKLGLSGLNPRKDLHLAHPRQIQPAISELLPVCVEVLEEVEDVPHLIPDIVVLVAAAATVVSSKKGKRR